MERCLGSDLPAARMRVFLSEIETRQTAKIRSAAPRPECQVGVLLSLKFAVRHNPMKPLAIGAFFCAPLPVAARHHRAQQWHHQACDTHNTDHLLHLSRHLGTRRGHQPNPRKCFDFKTLAKTFLESLAVALEMRIQRRSHPIVNALRSIRWATSPRSLSAL